LKIVIDRNIRGAEETFGQHGELVAMEGRRIRKADLGDAELMIVRTATIANADLLEGTPVRFVGTTSIGTDHLDTDWLQRAAIEWANAPGCNADSAAQYTLAMIWLACQRLGRDLFDQRVGIIGRGNVGSRLHRLLTALGVHVVANDPPLADQGVPGLVSQDDALACDIVSLHVPLTDSGPYRTRGMLGQERLERMPHGALLVNAARGDVVDGDALLHKLRDGSIHAALDCWPGEPRLNSELLQRATVATPHVAGYSDDGKRNGTRIVYQAFCAWAGLTPVGRVADGRRLALRVHDANSALTEALEAACFVPRHDAALRRLAGLPTDEVAAGFDALRKDYPYRRDFHGWSVACESSRAAQTLSALGFVIDGSKR
jgi:erythronate-4-phosphate dehydrogenase